MGIITPVGYALDMAELAALQKTRKDRENCSICICLSCCFCCVPVNLCRSYDICCSDEYPCLKRCWTIGMEHTEKPKPENFCDLFWQAVGVNQLVYVLNSGCCIKGCAASLPPLEQLRGPERQRMAELLVIASNPPPKIKMS